MHFRVEDGQVKAAGVCARACGQYGEDCVMRFCSAVIVTVPLVLGVLAIDMVVIPAQGEH